MSITYLTVLVKDVPYLQKKENVPWRCDSNPFVSNHQCASTCSICVEGSALSAVAEFSSGDA